MKPEEYVEYFDDTIFEPDAEIEPKGVLCKGLFKDVDVIAWNHFFQRHIPKTELASDPTHVIYRSISSNRR